MKGRISTFAKNFYSIVMRPEMIILPGQLAFYFVLAIVPTISLISYSASLLKVSNEFIYNFLANVFSKDLASMLISTNLSATTDKWHFFVVLLVAYYISSNGASSIIVTSNTIYGIKNTNFFRRRLKAFIMTFIMILLIVFLLIVPVFGNSIMTVVGYMDISKQASSNIINVINILQGPVTWFIIFLIIKLIYTMAPDRRVTSRSVNYGAIFTTVCWIIGTAVYSYYINHIAHYDAYYGGLANVVVLMLWFYYLAFIFTIGMGFNYHKEEEEIEKTKALNIIK
jgi:membrane protein